MSCPSCVIAAGTRWPGDSTVGDSLFWWLVLHAAGLGGLASGGARLRLRFADRGYALAKGIGLLLVGYLVWIGASLKLVADCPPTAWLALLA